MQLWMFIVTILINDCVYSSFNWVKFEKLHSIVVKYTPRQSRTEAIVLFCFYQSIKPKWCNGMHSSRTILSILDFLNHLILVKCKYLCTKSCLYHFVTVFIVEIQKKMLLSFHPVAVVAYF